MSESLRDQLLKAGFVAKPQNKPQPPEKAAAGAAAAATPTAAALAATAAFAAPRGRRDRPRQGLRAARQERTRGRERAQREAEQRAREKRERKQKLAELLNGKSLNVADAEIPRHFPHANKIRRIYVTADQLPRLNGGELAVAQFAGRYLLVTRETGLAAQTVDPEALVLLCDPHATEDDGVPADLVW